MYIAKPSTALLTEDELKPAVNLVSRVLAQLGRILFGQSELQKLVLVGILSRGHILLEGMPGLGKTALIKALGSLLRLEFKRVQFTPDLMPGDIVGAHILQETSQGKREMVFQEGPVFANILLADEINRASPKTQSALLEAMQERSVTLLGTTRALPSPFFVLASQNPIELEGTYPLPEAQLDRFLFKLIVKNLDVPDIEQIIAERRRGEPPSPDWTMELKELESVFMAMERIHLPRMVAHYIARLTAATHPKAKEATAKVRRYVSYGTSPRAAIGIAEAARAHALLSGRPTAGFEDVKKVATAVLNHRLILNFQARFDQVDAVQVVEDLLSGLDETGMNLLQGMEVHSANEDKS